MSQMGNLISKAEARGGAAAEEGGAKAEQERTEQKQIRGKRRGPECDRIHGPVGARRVTVPPR